MGQRAEWDDACHSRENNRGTEDPSYDAASQDTFADTLGKCKKAIRGLGLACSADIAATTPDRFEKMFDISDGRQASGLEILWWVFTDIAHHRGQAEVYLRVKNITPPHYRF